MGLDEDYNSYYYGAYAFELAMFWDLFRLSRVAATCEIGIFPCWAAYGWMRMTRLPNGEREDEMPFCCMSALLKS